MKLIQDLQELIEDEIHDVKKYAKMATELKADYPSLAQALYTISTQEDVHQATIHGEVIKIIQEHRKAHGEPPAPMMATSYIATLSLLTNFASLYYNKTIKNECQLLAKKSIINQKRSNGRTPC